MDLLTLLNLSSPTALLQKTGNAGMQEGGNAIFHSAHGKKAHLLAKAMTFLIGVQILLSIFCPQEARAQESRDFGVSDLEQRLKEIDKELISIDEEFGLLKDKLSTVTSEMNELKEQGTKPRGFLSRIAGIFRTRRLGKLYTESQVLSDRIVYLQKKREPLVSEFVALADQLIDKSRLRITVLVETEAVLSNDVTVLDEAMKQVSALWQLAERTAATRNKYAPSAFGPERKIAFPALLSNDPEELRLGAAILKDHATAARSDAVQLERQIENLQLEKSQLERIMELRKERQRSDEESGAVGVGTASIPWSFGDAATKRKIEEIEEKIDKYSTQMRKLEADAERFESQGKTLEQQASQIDAEFRGRSEND